MLLLCPCLMFFLLLLTVPCALGDRLSRVVETKHGRLQGRLAQVQTPPLTPDGGGGAAGGGYDEGGAPQVEVFKGIPFAAPPVGSLRFMPPVTVSPWRNVKSAEKFRKVCPQQFPASLGRNRSETLATMSEGRMKEILRVQELLKEQGEDCLYLNVYAPLQKGKKKRRKLHSFSLSACPPVCLSACPPVRLSAWLSACPSLPSAFFSPHVM